ncbi:MAG: asparagine synthetase B, partial [Candidatus Eisenbacteria bacterium]|nr:asparagine synthetase B [Candidatus Eisenbacteria bacterium]
MCTHDRTRRAPAARLAAAIAAAAVLLGLGPPGDAAARLLVPMDLAQSDHLRAYGVAYHALELGETAEWLLNYRGGSFLLADTPANRQELQLAGVRFEPLSGGDEAGLYGEIAEQNMQAILLEKAPRIAVYAPPEDVIEPWDDAVMLALEYAEIPYDRIYDEEVLAGRLDEYDWLHLHHEDFTGQYGKFYASFRNAEWYRLRQQAMEAHARAAGFAKVWQHKQASALAIREYVARGGFLFAMCSGGDSFDIAL